MAAYKNETITVDNSAIGFTAANIASPAKWGSRVRKAFCTLDTSTGPIRFTYDGTTPTTTVGHILTAGNYVVIEGEADIANFMAIRTGSTSGTLIVTYET